MTSDTGLAYVDGDQTFNKEQAPCRFKIFSELFCRIDDAMGDIPKHMQAKLYPSEIVTLGLVFALKGVGERAFYRWLAQDHLDLFPNLPDRTRLFRLFKVHQDWTQCFLADPTVLGIADTDGIELIHPIREGRSEAQIGKKGKSSLDCRQ